jgi:ribosomal protein L37E
MYCERCGKKTFSLQYWFEKMVCDNCYRISRANQENILLTE